MIRLIKLILLLTCNLACGQLTYKNVTYDEAGPPADESPIADCSLAQKGFATLIEPIVEETCIGCHVEGGQAADQFQFIAGETLQNLEVFRNLRGGDADAIITKAGALGVQHGGGQALKPDEFILVRGYFSLEEVCRENQ
jgi:hypothetical protein